MKKSFLYLTAFVCLLSLASCERVLDCEDGDGALVTEELVLDEFHSIALSDNLDVVIQQGETQKVEVKGYANLIEDIQTEVDNNEWKIKMTPGCYDDLEDMQIFITIPDIENIKITGSGDVTLENLVEVDRLDFKTTGSGDIECDCVLNVEDLNIKITGSGDVSLTGNTPNQEIEIMGSGDVENFEMISDDTSVNISGSGSAEVFVNNHLDVRITGSGDVEYKGNPTISTDITGSGSVDFRD